MPYTVEVTAVTRTSGTDELRTGPAGTVTHGPGCQVDMRIEGGLTSPYDIGVQLFRVSGYDPYVSVDCDLLLDGVAVWSGRCGTLSQSGEDGQYLGYGAGFEPNTDHEIVLRVQQYVGGPTYSNTIELSTPSS